MDLDAGCRATQVMLHQITRGWHPNSHWLHPPKIRRTVTVMLLISERLWRMYLLYVEPPTPFPVLCLPLWGKACFPLELVAACMLTCAPV